MGSSSSLEGTSSSFVNPSVRCSALKNCPFPCIDEISLCINAGLHLDLWLLCYLTELKKLLNGLAAISYF